MKLKLLPGVIAALLLFFGTSLVTIAQRDMPNSKRMRFPDSGAAISVSIPDDWSTITFPYLLVIKPKAGMGKISLATKDNVSDPQAELRKTLDYAKGQGAELTWESQGEASELNGMKGFRGIGRGTKNGETWMLAEWIFTPDGKRYFSLSAQGKENDEQMHRYLEAIVTSIKPASAPAK